jgi:hypothetical protein
VLGLNEVVTVNVAEAEFEPWVAVTVWFPADSAGTSKLVENPPLELGLTIATSVSLKVTVISGVGSNSMPVIFTEVPTGPKDGLIAMRGISVGVTVNVFEFDLTPSVALTAYCPGVERGAVKSASKSPLLSVGTGLEGTSNPPKVTITLEFGSKLVPETLTGVPKGPEVGLSSMLAEELPVVSNCQVQLESTSFELEQSK